MRKPPKGKPFLIGYDPRRYTEGPRPKIPALDELLAEVLAHERNEDGLTIAKELLIMLAERAIMKGDVRAAEVLLERGYGKVKQEFDHTTKGNPINNLITQVEIIKTVRNDSNGHATGTGAENSGLDKSGIPY